MVNYIKSFYKDASTIIEGSDWKSDPIDIKRGVLQGDPLSPILFNLVINKLLERLPSEIGVDLAGRKINFGHHSIVSAMRS